MAVRNETSRERLLAAVGEPEPEPIDQAEEERSRVRAEARAHLGLADDATLEDIQEAFAGSLWQYWLFFFPHYRGGTLELEDVADVQDTLLRGGGVAHLAELVQETPSAPFHRDLCEDLQAIVVSGRGGEELARAYPREHAKSVFATLVTPSWAVFSEHRRFPVLFSDTDSQAWEFLDDIKIEVETNFRLQAIYPDACVWKKQPRQNRLVFGNDALIVAAGSGKSMRGARKQAQRPDMIVLDDIENDAEVENPNRRRKKRRWYSRVVKKLGKAAVIIIVGTILHAESFLATAVKDDAHIHAAVVQDAERQDLWAQWESILRDHSLKESVREQAAWDFYEANREEMDRGGVVLWPERFTLYELYLERFEDLASYLSERQNRPFDPAASWFPEDHIIFLSREEEPSIDDVVLSVGFWDPSRGTSTGDTSSAPRLDVLKDGRRLVRWSLTDRVVPEEVMDTIIGQEKLRHFDVFGVEKVALSSYDEQLQTRALASGVALRVEPVTPKGSKDLRIKSMRPLIVGHTLVFSDSLPIEAKRQLKFYPQHPNDDFPDAIEQASRLADVYMVQHPAAGASVDPADDDDDERPDAIGGRRGSLLGRLRDRGGLIGRAFT